MDTTKLKEILAGLLTVHTCGNDSITMAQCLLHLDQYIKEQEAKSAEVKAEDKAE